MLIFRIFTQSSANVRIFNNLENTSIMLQKTPYVVFLILNIKCVKPTGIESFHGVRTGGYPKSSCRKIDNVISTGRCLAKCGILMDEIIMVSLDKSTRICMCCNDITGGDIIGSNWKTFVPRMLIFSLKIVLFLK